MLRSLTNGNFEEQTPALTMLAQGLPMRRTLEAVARMASHLQFGSRCALLLPGGQGYVLAASVDLRPADRALLKVMAQIGSLDELRSFGEEHCIEARPLLTQAAELVGILLIFEFPKVATSPQVMKQLDEICVVATLTIEQRNLTEDLTYRAHHDSLTHLWNRSCMEEQIRVALEAGEELNRITGLILVGIDSFRLFNELLGRQAGDELLRKIAARLTEALEPGSLLARSSGDEFTILMPNLQSEARLEAFARQLRSWFEMPFVLGEHELLVRASFGTAAAHPGECQTNDLQNRADQALLFAKRCARGRISTYSDEMARTPLERLLMERHLRFALQKREFELYYQPQIDLLSGKMTGMEALLRWKHQSLGYISPAVFVPVAEDIGIIEEIDEWVIGEAMRQLKAWQDSGMGEMHMGVNVSAAQFARKDFATVVAKRLRSTQIDPHWLELEITETALMTNLDHAARQLNLLRSLGIQVALDDFGTGHSSLAYLQNLPIDRIKIDRMFVKDIAASDERPKLLSSIIQMGLSIGCKVIAEGVETVEQALALSSMNCREGQGFLFAKPMSAKDLVRWVEGHPTRLVGEEAPAAGSLADAEKYCAVESEQVR